jgi:hypothetical protein
MLRKLVMEKKGRQGKVGTAPRLEAAPADPGVPGLGRVRINAIRNLMLK